MNIWTGGRGRGAPPSQHPHVFGNLEVLQTHAIGTFLGI